MLLALGPGRYPHGRSNHVQNTPLNGYHWGRKFGANSVTESTKLHQCRW